MPTEEILEEVRRKVREYASVRAHGVVHVRGNTVEVNDKLHFTDNEIAVVFLNRGEHYVVMCGTPDGDFIEAMGDGNYVRKKIKEAHEAAQRALQHTSSIITRQYAEFDMFVAKVFFAVDDMLREND